MYIYLYQLRIKQS